MSSDLDNETQALPQDKRHALLKDALLVTIPVDHSNAIKSTCQYHTPKRNQEYDIGSLV